MTSVHLFRSRKKPFNHEYVVLRFVNKQGVDSWLRLERAAQLGRHPYVPTPHNLTPLTQGMPARETASFSATLTELSHYSDEITRIVLTTPLSSNIASPSLLVEDIAYEVVRTQATNPLYQLFTVNCRWFARRICLNIAQWCENTKKETTYDIIWRGKPSSFAYFVQKLPKEPFGGGHLEKGGRGARVRIENSMALAVQLLSRKDDTSIPAVVSVCEDALDLLKTVDDGSSKDVYLLAYILVTLADATARTPLGSHMALPYAKRAFDVLKPFRDEWRNMFAHVLSRYAASLSACGPEHAAAAYEAQTDAVSIVRQLSVLDLDLLREKLGDYVHDLGVYLTKMERYDEACTSFKEAINLRTLPTTYDSSKRIQRLALSYEQYGITLRRMSSTSEAIRAFRQSIALTRDIEQQDPHGWQQVDLAQRLYSLAFCLRTTSTNGSNETFGFACWRRCTGKMRRLKCYWGRLGWRFA